MSMGDAVGVTASLDTASAPSGHDVTVLLQAIYLMGNPVQNASRCLGTAEVNDKYYLHIIAVCTINTLLSIWVMQLINQGVIMPDLPAAEFTLLQGAHLFTPEDWGICDALLAKKLLPSALIPSDILY